MKKNGYLSKNAWIAIFEYAGGIEMTEINKNEEHLEIQKLRQMLSAGSSAALTVEEAARQLKEAGFEEVHFSDTWGLNQGGKYFMKHHATTLFAFTVGEKLQYRDSFRIAAAHTDYPCLRIKPNPDITGAGYQQANVEVYGGPILNTWLDRPLGISGRVAVRSDNLMRPDMRLVDIREPLMVIPNLAIHLNKEVNKGVELNRQTDMLPITATIRKELEENVGFLDYLAKELKVSEEDILDYELWVTCLEQPQSVGIQKDLMVSPRLDNLTSVQALLSAIIDGKRDSGFNLIALFDHEEIGSRSKQGAASLMLLNVMEKICESFGRNSMQTKEIIYDSMLISADVAQGTHPNHLGKMDVTTKPVLNGGFCIKEACSQSYATDCEAVAIVEQICRTKEIPYQKFVNRSDLPGGGTLGAIVSSVIPIPTVDIGVPMLAMHSAVETMGVEDQIGMTRFLTEFFSI